MLNVKKKINLKNRMQGISSQMLTKKFWINFLFVFYKMSKQKNNGAENIWILKEAVSVISSDPLCNDDNVWFTTVPFVWWSDQAWIRYPSSVFFSFEVSLQMWLAHMKQLKFHQNKNTFRVSKTTFMIRFWFEGYRCKSAISIFAWRVPWKYAHSPYQSTSD